MALLMLDAFTPQSDWRTLSEKTLNDILPSAVRYPTAFAFWLQAIDLAAGPVEQIAIAGSPTDPLTQEMLKITRTRFRPRSVFGYLDSPRKDSRVEFLMGRYAPNQKPTAYICRNFVCNLPAYSVVSLIQQLDNPVPAVEN
jgi:uncharacterized protein YyaL (SSP411 family)